MSGNLIKLFIDGILLLQNTENTSITDVVFFEAMLSAIGVMRKKTNPVVAERVATEPWKPKWDGEECPY